MFDDLRQQALSEPEEEKKKRAEPAPQKVVAAPKARKKSKVIFGLTGSQRFAVTFLLMLMTCVTGVVFLFITNKIAF